MQSPAETPSASSSSSPSTKERILAAAVTVCGAQGLWGATTREIAAAAGVNEVTLFRHFGSKEKLIAALLERSVAAQMEALQQAEPLENDLEADLLHFARPFQRLLNEHETLIRAVISEGQRHPHESHRVLAEAILPLRHRLRTYLVEAQKRGTVRSEVAIDPAIDCFTGMLLSEMLRRSVKGPCLSYTAEEFLESSVGIFVRGIAAPARGGRRKG